MTITFKYTPELLQRAHELHYKKFFPLRGRIILFLGILAVWAGLLLLLAKGGGTNLWFSIPLIVYGVFAMVAHFIVARNIGKRAYKKLKEYHDPFSMSITGEGVNIAIHDNQYLVPWSDIKKALMAPDMVLLYPSDQVFFIFPKRSFTDGSFSSFETLVREKVAKIY